MLTIPYHTISYHIWVSVWLNLTAFLGTADSEVHIVPISRVIIISYMKYRNIDSISHHIPCMTYHVIYRIIWHYIPYHTTQNHVTWYHISCRWLCGKLYHIIPYHTIPYHNISYILSYHATPCHIISHIISQHIMSYHWLCGKPQHLQHPVLEIR